MPFNAGFPPWAGLFYVAPSARVFSGVAARLLLFSQTRFFFKRKNGFEAPVKEPQRKPFKKVSSGLLRKQRGCGPSDSPGLLDSAEDA